MNLDGVWPEFIYMVWAMSVAFGSRSGYSRRYLIPASHSRLLVAKLLFPKHEVLVFSVVFLGEQSWLGSSEVILTVSSGVTVWK